MFPTAGYAPRIRKVDLLLFLPAFSYFLLLWIPGFSGSYGYFIDEFYYLSCASHPALGYVDHPPLSVGFLLLLRGGAGDALPVIRLVPALAGAVTIYLVGLTARRLGAGPGGQLLAAGAAMAGTVYHVMFSFYSMNAISLLLWTAGFLTLIEIERRGDQRLWLLFGLLAGLGFENKHTFLLLPFGLVIGLLLTKGRTHLKSRWFWAGCAITAVLALPNIWWQAANGWPSIEFYRNADLYKNVPTPPGMVLFYQIFATNPGALPVWVAGLYFFLLSRRGESLRHLGWIYVVLLALMLVGQKSRPDRIAEAYIVLFAGGGTFLADAWRRRGLRWLRWAVPALLVSLGAALAPLGITVLPPEMTARYAAGLGVVPQIEKGEGKASMLPQWLADRLGWEEYVEDVCAAAKSLAPAERQRAIVLVPTYGQGGALELLGRGRDLPPIFATQNSCWHWGPPPASSDVTIVTGPFSAETVRELFAEDNVFRVYTHDWCTPWRNNTPVWITRGPRAAWSELWPWLRHYE